jgi:hypothetical protein
MTTTAEDATTAKLRTARVQLALIDRGFTPQNAKAAAQLIDCEFGDDGEPKNLADAIAKASKAYGTELFESESEDGDGGEASAPDLHQGARTPKHEDKPTGLFPGLAAKDGDR